MKITNRRQFNKWLGKGIVAVPVSMLTASLPARASDTPMVDLESPTAKALQYIAESDKGVNCAGCALYVAADAGDIGACAVFPGVSVAAAAWCSAYVANPS